MVFWLWGDLPTGNLPKLEPRKVKKGRKIWEKVLKGGYANYRVLESYVEHAK